MTQSNKKDCSEKANKLLVRIKNLYIAATKTPERVSFCYSVLLHFGFIVALILLATLLQHKPNTLNLAGARAVVELEKNQIVQAQAISTQTLDHQVQAYQAAKEETYQRKVTQEQQRQANIKAIEQKFAEAHQAELERQEAFKKAEATKQKALFEAAQQAKKKRQREEKAQQEAKEKQQEKQNQEKAQAQQKAILKAKDEEDVRQKTAELAQQKAQAKSAQASAAKASQEAALKALRQSMLSDLEAQSSEVAAQSATEKALQAYAGAYKARIEAVWIMDDCRKISANHLPTVMIMPGQAPRISVSSGNLQCDRSLLLAFRNAQAPELPPDKGARKLIVEGVDFKFSQQG